MVFFKAPANQVVWNIIEYQATWPIDKMDKTKYKFNLVGSKLFLIDAGQNKELKNKFHPIIDPDNWDISGSKLYFKFKLKGAGKAVMMENEEKHRISSDCVSASVKRIVR